MASRDVLEHLLDPERRRLDEIAERRARFNQYAVIAIFIVLLAMWAWAYVRTISEPKINQVTITDARVEGDHELCAGDTLVLAYEFRANGAGKLIEDATIWRETPPKTIIYSEEKPFLLGETIDQTIYLAWPVPKTYINSATAKEEPFSPGEYRRVFAVSSISQPAVFTMASVAFSVKDSCDE